MTSYPYLVKNKQALPFICEALISKSTLLINTHETWNKMEAQQTPLSPTSFDFYPGTPDTQQNSEMKSFRFAGAPDGPLPSIPSGG